jgi:hypothetical protein
MDERNTPGALADAINDQAGKIEEAALVLAALMESLESCGQGAKTVSVLSVIIRDLSARQDALTEIAGSVEALRSAPIPSFWDSVPKKQ